MSAASKPPTSFSIKVRGRIGSQGLQAEHAFKVAAGEVVKVDLTLQ